MRRGVLIGVAAVAAAIAGFFFHRVQAEDRRQAAHVETQLKLRGLLTQAEADLAAEHWKEARDAALAMHRTDGDFEPARVAFVLSVSEKELPAAALLSAGERALEKGQLLAVRLALDSVPLDTQQTERRAQLAAALAARLEDRFVQARAAETGEAEAVKAALRGLEEVLQARPHDATALLLADRLEQRLAELGRPDLASAGPSVEGAERLLEHRDFPGACAVLDQCGQGPECRKLQETLVGRAGVAWARFAQEQGAAAVPPVRTWKELRARRPFQDDNELVRTAVAQMQAELEQRDFRKAEEGAFRLLALDPVNASAHGLLARLPNLGREAWEAGERLRATRPEDARSLFEEALKQSPDNAWHQKANESLAALPPPRR